MPAPIAFFAFNRPEHTRLALSALADNDLASETEVHIFCDGPRNEADLAQVKQVREICRNATGFAKVTVQERELNMGLAKSCIAGVNFLFEKYESIIFFEDDSLTSPYTLRFLNTCLEKYKDKSTIFNISAWSPDPALMGFSPDYPWDVYFIPRFNSWGWASWKDRWQSIDWDLQEAETFFNDPYAVRAFCQGGADMPGMLQAQIEGRINSWSVRADFARFCQGRLGLNPIHSYVENIGLDGSGTHCGEIPQFIVDLKKASATPRLPDYIFVDEEFEKGYRALCSGPLWVSPEEEEKRRTAAELANVAAELAHAHDQCEYFEQAMRIQQAELASYENSKAVQGILQLKDICRRRAWRQLPGWGWWAVRFVYQKLF